MKNYLDLSTPELKLNYAKRMADNAESIEDLNYEFEALYRLFDTECINIVNLYVCKYLKVNDISEIKFI